MKGLLLWRVTGGRFACERLAQEYHGQFIQAAKQGGMAKVCEMEHWKERIEARPGSRRIDENEPRAFHCRHVALARDLLKGADFPVIRANGGGAQIRSIPACIVPGNDNTHGRQTGESLGRLLPKSNVHILFPKHHDEPLGPREEWDEKAGEMAALFGQIMKRVA